ncbi:MAG TPA: hypothetical protein VGY77_05425 [Gemmataceae bacterium]|jgi:hypothetical protein|nr:hypothetical protein [Gemmataceae bacterium]
MEIKTQDSSSLVRTGTLHIYVAFDWGDEINLDHAGKLVPAEVHDLLRRRRTPSSIGYRPPPLRFQLDPVKLELPEIGLLQVAAEATVFDFAAVSVALHAPFHLSEAQLTNLAGWLADPAPLVQTAQRVLKPLHQRLLAAIQKPIWQDDLSEEYFVFHLPPPAPPIVDNGQWVAGLVRLESMPLSREEVAEALKLHLSYTPEDLLVLDWAAAVLFDQVCDETLQIIEFANLQLLEFRHIDNRLERSLAEAYRSIEPLGRSWFPFLRSYSRPLRALGGLKVEANGLFERTENVLKLVGDQYLARAYRLLAARFHLQDWEHDIQRKLEVGEGVYKVLSDQAATYRTELLEIIVIILIFVEIILALFRH